MDRETHRLSPQPIAVVRIADGRYVTVEQRFFPRTGSRAP